MHLSIYLIRHGETLFNQFNKMQGWSDTPLLDSSKLKAKNLGESFHGIALDAVYSSDSGRVLQTRDAFLSGYAKPVPLTVDERLREMYFGHYEGDDVTGLWTSMAAKEGFSSFDQYKYGVDVVTRCGTLSNYDELAESEADLRQRASLSLDDIVKSAVKNKKQNIVIVSHGLTILTLLKIAGVEEEFHQSLHNLSVSKLIVDDALRCEYYGEAKPL